MSTQRLRVAICGTYGIPARYGGFETCVEETATRLAQRGHEVTVYCPRLPGRVELSNYRGVRLRYNRALRTKHAATLSQTAQAMGQAIARRVDVIHCYIIGNAPLLAAARAAGIATVLSVDGLEWRRAKWDAASKTYLRLCERLSALLADELIVDSEVVSRYYAARYGRPGVYAPYGTFTAPPAGPSPLSRLGLSPEGYLLFVGRLTPEKNVHELIRAYRLVKTEKPLVIVGDDPFSRDYVASLKRDADPRVRFLGYVYGDASLHLFANAYLYVTASGLEGTSPALLTAMGQGRGCLVNGIPENRETLGDTGTAYAENDAADLRRRLQYLVDHPEAVAAQGALARRRAATVYNWDRVTETLETTYWRVRRQRTSRPATRRQAL